MYDTLVAEWRISNGSCSVSVSKLTVLPQPAFTPEVKLLAETKQKPGFEAVMINQQGVIDKVSLAQPAYTSIYDGIYNAITHTGPAIVSQAEMLDLARLLALCRESVVTSNVMAWR